MGLNIIFGRKRAIPVFLGIIVSFSLTRNNWWRGANRSFGVSDKSLTNNETTG